MLVFSQLLELRQMPRHLSIRKPFTISTVIPHRKRNEVISYKTTDIQVVMQTVQTFIMKKFMFRVSHCFCPSALFPFSLGYGRDLALQQG